MFSLTFYFCEGFAIDCFANILFLILPRKEIIFWEGASNQTHWSIFHRRIIDQKKNTAKNI